MMSAKLVNSMKPYQLKIFKNVRMQSSVAQALAASPETQQSSLSNGLRIASKDTGGEVCTVGMWIDAGSRCETPANNGVSNFVEHMLFKGTQNKTQAQVEAQIEGLGAQFGAHTSREQIAYYAKCLKKDVPAVVEILSDAVQNPLFNEDVMEKERGVILREMEQSSTDLETVVMDYLHATAYQGTALGLPVTGTSANIESLSRADLLDYVSANFTAPRIALAAAGGVDHSALVKSAEANLSGLSSSVDSGSVAPCRFTGGSVSDRNDDLPFNHVAIAVQGCGWTSDDHLPLMLAKSIVGSWSKGMAGAASVFGLLGPRAMSTMQSYGAFNHTYTETSLFGIHLVSTTVEVDDAMECVTREMVRLCGDITDSDVARAKAALQTNLLLQQDDTSGVCVNIGQHLLAHGEHISALNVCQTIDAITTQDVKNACMKYVYDKCPAVASVGPTEAVQDYNIVRSRLYWMRF